jgi:hypothetical protein
MIYVKSILAGVAALFIASVLYFYLYYALLIRSTLPKVPPGSSVGIDIRVFNLPLLCLIALLAFALGSTGNFAELQDEQAETSLVIQSQIVFFEITFKEEMAWRDKQALIEIY